MTLERSQLDEGWFAAHAGQGDAITDPLVRREWIASNPSCVLAYFTHTSDEELKCAITARPCLLTPLCRQQRISDPLVRWAIASGWDMHLTRARLAQFLI
jgi:hypothetical protein